MFYVYILKSKKDGKVYIGSTKDLRKRFKQHAEGKVFSTRYRLPVELRYYEAYYSEKDARERERNLKLKGQALLQLKKRINKSIA